MNEFFTQFKTIARTLRLSQSEKQAMRVQLYNYLERNPAGSLDAPAKIAQPVPSTFYFFSPRFAMSVVLILIIGLGSGTAFAAQGALPGDTLYPIKINVNEAVQTALATSPEAKAEVNAELATTRLEEAETLASSGKLDASTTAELAVNFTAHAQAAQTNTDSLQSADFDTTLSAHSAILAQIGDDSSSTETMQNTNSLAMEVEREADHSGRDNGGNGNNNGNGNGGGVVAIATATNATVPAASNGARIRTFAAAIPQTGSTSTSTASSSATASLTKVRGKTSATSSNPQDIQTVKSLSVQASSSLADVTADFASIKAPLDADTSAQIQNQITSMQALYATASTSLKAGDASSAKNGFSSVIHMSIKLETYMEAAKKFNIKLLSGLLTNMGNGNQGGGKGPSIQVIPPVEIQTSGSSSNASSTQSGSGKGDSNNNSVDTGGDGRGKGSDN